MLNPLIIAIAGAVGMIFGLLGGVFMAVPKIQLPEKKPEVVVDLADPVAPKTMDDFTQVAKELDSWRKELTDQRNEAIRYDAELLKREQLLKAEREALNRERERLTDLQKDIQTSLIKIKSDEEPKLAQMADLYQTMKPEDSVNLLKQMSTVDATDREQLRNLLGVSTARPSATELAREQTQLHPAPMLSPERPPLQTIEPLVPRQRDRYRHDLGMSR